MNEIQIGDGEKSKKKRLKSHIEEPKKRWGFDPLDAFAGTGYDPEFRAKFAEDYSEQVKYNNYEYGSCSHLLWQVNDLEKHLKKSTLWTSSQQPRPVD